MEGQCPRCGKILVQSDYEAGHSPEWEADNITYLKYFVCGACSFEGVEIFEFHYVETITA
jgi:hypothetical protein